ncbi:MAG TPA: hypothetical protein VFR67_00345 [Pilimelia sp.]|nr:hypothetical protein [Pilimelia sp.]
MAEAGAAWVAGTVRARAIGRRRLGAVAIHHLAASPSVTDAVDALVRSPYGRYVHAGDSLATAQRGVAETLLWNVRVLAGWLPARGARALRALAGWFEIANVDERLQDWAGRPAAPPFRMGALATAWPRLASATSPPELRTELAASAWSDPGGATPRDIQLGMRLSWAQRVTTVVPPAAEWAAGAVALLVARERFVRAAALPDQAAAAVTRILGADWAAATSIDDLAGRVRPAGRWAVRGIRSTAELWRAEAVWWARLRADGLKLLAGSGFAATRPLGAVAVLAVDAWQVSAALALAARGGGTLEVIDGLA